MTPHTDAELRGQIDHLVTFANATDSLGGMSHQEQASLEDTKGRIAALWRRLHLEG